MSGCSRDHMQPASEKTSRGSTKGRAYFSFFLSPSLRDDFFDDLDGEDDDEDFDGEAATAE